MEKIGVIGAGSWGTALAILLNENGNDVTLWSHRAEEAAKVQKDREISKLPGIHIPESIAVTADIYTHRDSNVLHENISRLDTPTTNQVLKMGENWWGN